MFNLLSSDFEKVFLLYWVLVVVTPYCVPFPGVAQPGEPALPSLLAVALALSPLAVRVGEGLEHPRPEFCTSAFFSAAVASLHSLQCELYQAGR